MIEVKNNKLSHGEVDTCLKSIIKNKSYSNGYIFCGAEGLGKKQTAFHFIEEIFKQSSVRGNIEEKILNNNHPDFLLIEPSSLIESKRSKSSHLEKFQKYPEFEWVAESPYDWRLRPNDCFQTKYELKSINQQRKPSWFIFKKK